MQINQALRQLQQATEEGRGRHLKLCIPVFQPGAIGGTPCVMVKDIQSGFDWDQGRVMLTTEEHLTVLSPENVAAIRDSVRRGQSWHAYQAHCVMNDKLKAAEARIEALQAELDALRSQAGVTPIS